MGILGFLQKILRKKAQPQALEAEVQSVQSPQSLIESQINQSITEKSEISKLTPPVELQKESLQLGIAAGYTGKSLREIESSIGRVESQMITKDWFTLQFKDHLFELIETMKKHEENEEERFKAIQESLSSLKTVAKTAPEPIKTELYTHIKDIEERLPLTRKMQKLIAITKEFKEISYTDLAEKLGISESALRGMLSLTTRRTDSIERFEKDGKGWVRFIERLNHKSINQSQG